MNRAILMVSVILAVAILVTGSILPSVEAKSVRGVFVDDDVFGEEAKITCMWNKGVLNCSIIGSEIKIISAKLRDLANAAINCDEVFDQEVHIAFSTKDSECNPISGDIYGLSVLYFPGAIRTYSIDIQDDQIVITDNSGR